MDANVAEARVVRQPTGADGFDVDQVIEQIWSELGGEVSRQTVRQVVSDLALEYRGARIPTYVPIFVRREALRELIVCK